MSIRLTTKRFIEKARLIHGNRFDYSKVNYINASEKVTIICPDHGEFHQRAGAHLRGSGCAHRDHRITDHRPIFIQ